MFACLARFCHHRRRLVAAVWLAVLLAGFAYGGHVFGRLGTGNDLRSDAESVRAFERLGRLSHSGTSVTAVADGRPVDDPALKASVQRVAARISATPGVVRVTDWYRQPLPALVARDRRGMLIRVELAEGLKGARRNQVVDAVGAELRTIAAPRVLVGGDGPARREFQDTAQHDLERGEASSLPVMLVLLLVIFGGRPVRRQLARPGLRARAGRLAAGCLSVLTAAAMPLVLAAMAVAGALLLLLGISHLTDVSVYAVNVVTMLGLGLAVDYSLLVVSRFREERAAGYDLPLAVERTMATAGRTVAFSGLTVAVSLAGMLVFAEPFLHSMAWGGIGVVLVAMLAAITLVPALLGAWGGRIRPARPARPDRGYFYRQSRLVQRRALLLVPVVAGVLLLLAVPFRHARLANSGLESLPRSSASRQLFELTRARFPGAGTDPITVLADLGPTAPQLEPFLDRIRALPGVVTATRRPLPTPTLSVVDVIPAGASQGPTATSVVRELRALQPPAPIQVTGAAAFLVDYRDSLVQRLPSVFGLIALATLLLLFLMTGSVVVPVKAIVMNVLSLGASFGALVWVFQEGHLHGLLRFDPAGMVDITIPVLVFVFAFGLSMDYEVFLISRIKEAWDETGDNDAAVALGLQRTGRIVTSAALLIVVVFLGFAASDLLTIKEVGVGMAIAVILDATVVRTLLVPATMKLMGRRNWWAPARLRRLHDRIGLSETPPGVPVAASAAPAEPDRAPVG